MFDPGGDPVPCTQESLGNCDEDEDGLGVGTPCCRACFLGKSPPGTPAEWEGTGGEPWAEARSSFGRPGWVALVLGHQHSRHRPSCGV